MFKGMTRLALILEEQPEGGFTITSPSIREFVTEADTWAEVGVNVEDALNCLEEVDMISCANIKCGRYFSPKSVREKYCEFRCQRMQSEYNRHHKED